MTGFIFCNRFGNVPNPQSANRAIKGSLQIIMQLSKSPQRNNTVKLFCYLISRRITCGTLFAQGFAKTKQT